MKTNKTSAAHYMKKCDLMFKSCPEFSTLNQHQKCRVSKFTAFIPFKEMKFPISHII